MVWIHYQTRSDRFSVNLIWIKSIEPLIYCLLQFSSYRGFQFLDVNIHNQKKLKWPKIIKYESNENLLWKYSKHLFFIDWLRLILKVIRIQICHWFRVIWHWEKDRTRVGTTQMIYMRSSKSGHQSRAKFRIVQALFLTEYKRFCNKSHIFICS